MIEKIISGGQTGADTGGLIAAKYLGIPTGGSIPKNFRREEGTYEENKEFGERFNLVEDPSPYYPPRTKENVIRSDGTVLFGKISSSGSKLTIILCRQYKKPFKANPSYLEFAEWVIENDIKNLNVAGNRESVSPGIQEEVSDFLVEAITFLKYKLKEVKLFKKEK